MYICQNFHHLANTLANTDSLLILNLNHLVNPLINTDNILKVKLCYLANILINTNDKTNNFTRERLVLSNQLLNFYY